MVWTIVKRWRYLIFGGLACLALVILLPAADHLLAFITRSSEKRTREQAQSVPRWRWFTNQDCGYVIEFPAKPFENPHSLNNTQKVKSFRQFAAALGNDRAFMVATLVPSFTNIFTDDQIKALLSLTATGTLHSGDKLVEEREILIGTNLGKEIEAIKADGSYVRARIYQVGQDLQELIVLVPRADRHSTNISRFLDSFRLISK